MSRTSSTFSHDMNSSTENTKYLHSSNNAGTREQPTSKQRGHQHQSSPNTNHPRGDKGEDKDDDDDDNNNNNNNNKNYNNNNNEKVMSTIHS